jgi:hypothetical protein
MGQFAKRTCLIVVPIVVMAGLLIAGLADLHSLPQRRAAEARVDKARATARLRDCLKWTGVALGPDDIVEVLDLSGRDLDIRARARVTPEQFRQIRTAVSARLPKGSSTDLIVVDADDVWQRVGRELAPPWWRPQDYADADALFIGTDGGIGDLFIFVPSKGLMFVLSRTA